MLHGFKEETKDFVLPKISTKSNFIFLQLQKTSATFLNYVYEVLTSLSICLCTEFYNCELIRSEIEYYQRNY